MVCGCGSSSRWISSWGAGRRLCVGADFLRAVCPATLPAEHYPSTGAPQGEGGGAGKKRRHEGTETTSGTLNPSRTLEAWVAATAPKEACSEKPHGRPGGNLLHPTIGGEFGARTEWMESPELQGWQAFRKGRPSLPEGSPAISSLNWSEPFLSVLRTSSLSPGLPSIDSQDLVSSVEGLMLKLKLQYFGHLM